MGRVISRLEVTDACHGCGVCVPACPREAITMHDGEAGPVARIDPDRCNQCRACLEACPVEAILEPYPPAWRRDGA